MGPSDASTLYFTGETSMDALLTVIATDLVGTGDIERRGGKVNGATVDWKHLHIMLNMPCCAV